MTECKISCTKKIDPWSQFDKRNLNPQIKFHWLDIERACAEILFHLRKISFKISNGLNTSMQTKLNTYAIKFQTFDLYVFQTSPNPVSM